MSALQQWFRREREKIGRLSPKAAAEYIWQYYKLWIIGAVCLVSLVIFSVHQYRHNVGEHWLYLSFVNTRAQVGDGSELWQGFVEKTGYDLTKAGVTFNNEAWFDYADNHASGNTYYQIFVGFIDSGILDAATMTPEALEEFGKTGRLLDWNREECASLREKYGDRLIYALPIDTEYSTQPVPIGIDISDSILMTEYHIYPEEEGCALGIGAFSQHLEAVEAFLDYICQEEQAHA